MSSSYTYLAFIDQLHWGYEESVLNGMTPLAPTDIFLGIRACDLFPNDIRPSFLHWSNPLY